jgi:hypothetical protein
LPEFDPNLTGCEVDPAGQLRYLLIHNRVRRFDENARVLENGAAHFGDGFDDSLPTLPLILSLVAVGQTLKTLDQLIAIRQPVTSHPVNNARRHDLLGAAATDTQEELDGCAVNERAGQCPEFVDNRI